MINFFEKILNKNSNTGNTYRTSKNITAFVESMILELTKDIQDEKMLELMHVDNILDKRKKPNTRMSKAECAYCTNKILTVQDIVREGYNQYNTKYQNDIKPKLDAYMDLICAGNNDEKLFEEIKAFYTADTLKKYFDEAIHHTEGTSNITAQSVDNTKETITSYLNYVRSGIIVFIELAVLCDTCPKFDFYGFEK